MLIRFSKSLSLPVGIWGFISKSFDLVSIVECPILLGVAPRSVVFIIFAFSLVALLLLPCCFLAPYDCYRGHCSAGHCSAAVVALLSVVPEVLVSLVPRPKSQMVPPPEESHAVAPAEAAHPLALVVQWADVQLFRAVRQVRAI
jgi:hypothetical protein